MSCHVTFGEDSAPCHAMIYPLPQESEWYHVIPYHLSRQVSYDMSCYGWSPSQESQESDLCHVMMPYQLLRKVTYVMPCHITFPGK